LFHLIRELAAARSLDETAETALRMADSLFNARTALLLNSELGRLESHPSSSLQLDAKERSVADWTLQNGRPAGRFTEMSSWSENMYLPMVRADLVLGVFVVSLPPDVARLTSRQRDLIDGFTAQIALLVEREQLCAAREHEKLLAESDRLHRTLFDCVSHELKTPLSVLRSAGEKLGPGDPEKQDRLADEIRTATRRLDHLVANLLNQTRLESGRLKLQLDWCEVEEVIDTARRSVGAALQGRPVRIEIAPDMPLFRADAVLMEQVLANLLLNAALHTPAGSAVRLTAGLDREHARVFIAVADSGPGIPPEMSGILFQKFSRGAQTPAGGLGLGLSIVRGFMLAQGGDVSAGRSDEGGACFTVCLPYAAHDSVPNDER
jgi:two-component system sensor histidine kinase KdpD